MVLAVGQRSYAILRHVFMSSPSLGPCLNNLGVIFLTLMVLPVEATNLSPGAALRECAGREERPCANCETIHSMLGDAKYCSDSCRFKAYRKRKKEKLLQEASA